MVNQNEEWAADFADEQAEDEAREANNFVDFEDDGCYHDPWQEHCDYEFNSRYDDVRERYAAEIRDAEREAEWEEIEARERSALFALVCFFTGYKPEPVPAPPVVSYDEDDIPF